jgi:hypothetical protein
MPNDQTAYSCDHHEVVAAYRDARAVFVAAADRTHRDAVAMGCTGFYGTGQTFGPASIAGLATDNPDDPPEGWQWSASAGYLKPRRGKAGQVARDWLDDHALPELDARAVLACHGLPRASRDAHDGASYKVMLPDLFEHDGTIWVLYTGTPGAWGGDLDPGVGEQWTPRKLSEFYAAKEAAEAAKQMAGVSS